MYRSNRSFSMPPRANPGHLTPLPSRGGGNLIIRVFQGVGNLISMRWGWGIWTAPTISCENSCVAGYHGDAVLGDFREKDGAFVANWLRGKGLIKQAWFWIRECIKVVFTMTYYQRFNATIKSSTEVNITLTCRMYKVSDDSCQWNDHDVVGGIFF